MRSQRLVMRGACFATGVQPATASSRRAMANTVLRKGHPEYRIHECDRPRRVKRRIRAASILGRHCMLTVYSDRHRLHHGHAELIDGEMKPCFEMPSRADFILER